MPPEVSTVDVAELVYQDSSLFFATKSIVAPPVLEMVAVVSPRRCQFHQKFYEEPFFE